MHKKQAKVDSNVTIVLNDEVRTRVYPAALTVELEGLEMPARVEGDKFIVTGDDFRKAVSLERPDVFRRMEVHEPRTKEIIQMVFLSHMASIATVNGRSVVRKRNNAPRGEEEVTA